MTLALYGAAERVLAARYHHPDIVEDAMNHLKQVMDTIELATPEVVKKTREVLANQLVEVDDFSYTSPCVAEGMWVQGWLWIPTEDE